MENKKEENDYNYILNMEALPEFDETTGEFTWNNNETNSNIKRNNDDGARKIEDKNKNEGKFLKENAAKYIEELKNILNK